MEILPSKIKDVYRYNDMLMFNVLVLPNYYSKTKFYI